MKSSKISRRKIFYAQRRIGYLVVDFTTRYKTTVVTKSKNYLSAWMVYLFGNQKLSQRR